MHTLSCGMWDLVPWPGTELGMHWEHEVLVTGLPGKSQHSSFFSLGLLKIQVYVHMNTQTVLKPGLHNVNSTCRWLTQVPLCQNLRPSLILLCQTKLTIWIQIIELNRLAYLLGTLHGVEVNFILSKQMFMQCLLCAWHYTRSWNDKVLAAEVLMFLLCPHGDCQALARSLDIF